MAEPSARRVAVRRKLLLMACFFGLGFGSSVAMAQSPAASTVDTRPAWQKAAGGKMAFEVASIRLAKPGTFRPANIDLNIGDTPIPPGGRFFADFPLLVYVEFAYKIQPTREQEDAMLSGLPKWVRTDHFVIQAEAPGNPPKDQMRLMMQSLLAERFKLKVHFETRVEPALAMVLVNPGRPGPWLRPHAEGLPCGAKWTPPADPLSKSAPAGGDIPICGSVLLKFEPHYTFLLGARDIPMEQIAAYMPLWQDFGRPVVDETGLQGTYDFTLYSTPDRTGPTPAAADPQLGANAPTFLEALKEQLGIKLKAEKAPVRHLVIDHIEPPSPN